MARGVAILRQGDCAVEVLSGAGTEEKVMAHLRGSGGDPSHQPIHLVLVPWNHYMEWSKLEGLFGLSRTHGPTLAGYFGEPIPAVKLPASRDIPRAILVDLANLDPLDWARTVRAIGLESLRSGCLGLLAPGTSVYTDHWLNGTPLGPRIDSISQLSEVTAIPDWQKRLPAARQITSALWSLIFEEGIGKADFNLPPKTLKASFQSGVDARAWVFRLCFSSQHFGPNEVMTRFWPNSADPWSLPQQIRKASDLLRVHWLPDSGSVEITAVLFASAPSVLRPRDARTLWLEPIQATLVTENPLEKAGSSSAPYLKALPLGAAIPSAAKPAAPDERQSKILSEMAGKLRDLSQMIRERDESIRELRSGGVGTAQPLPPPDTEGLLEAFQFRFAEAEDELQRLEQQVLEAERGNGDAIRLARTKKRIQELTEKEKNWIRTIAQTLERYRLKRAGGG